jgi:hypothetical protein
MPHGLKATETGDLRQRRREADAIGTPGESPVLGAYRFGSVR